MTYQRTGDVGRREFHWPVRLDTVRKLVCLPYAGGTSTVFRPLAEALGPGWQVVGIDPPGHGLGAPEAPLDSVPALRDALDAAIDPEDYADGYVLGYSVGGYVAHALISRWEDAGRPRPRGLVLCAANPPACRHLHPVYSTLSDDELLAELDGLGGLPAALRDERSIFNMFKHVVRAGFRAYETAIVPPGTIDTPALVVGGARDTVASPDRLARWRAHCGTVEVALVEGPHVFLPERRAELARLITGFAEAREEQG